MHIPPKPFRDREMKMSTERAVRKRKACKQGTTSCAAGRPGLGLLQKVPPHPLFSTNLSSEQEA